MSKHIAIKRNLLLPLLDKIDWNGLDERELLKDSNCFGVMYGAAVCARCTHKIKVGSKWHPLNRVCKELQNALTKKVEILHENEITSSLRGVKNLIKISKIKPSKKIKPVIGIKSNRTKQLKLALKAVKYFARRKHNEVDWIVKLKEIGIRYSISPIELVELFSEVISKSCNVKVLIDLLRLAENDC